MVVAGGPSPLLAEGPGWVFPRHSLLGGPLVMVAGGPSPLLAEGPGCGSPPLLAGVRRPRRWLFPWGCVGGYACCVCLWRGACAWRLCWYVCCVFVVSVLVVVRVWVCLPPVSVCESVCVCGVLAVCGCWSLLPPARACWWC